MPVKTEVLQIKSLELSSMSYKIVITILRLIARLPLSVLYVFSSMLWPVVYYVIRYRRKVTRQNLLRSFPEKDLKEIKRIERAFYRHMCDIVVETLKTLHVSDEEMQRRISVDGLDIIEKTAEEGHPVFLLNGHFGNWEWAAEVVRRMKNPTVHGYIYEPLASPIVDQVMRDLRQHYNTLLIAKQQAARTILRMKRDKKSYFIGFIADQRPKRNSLHHWTTFLHQDTPYMVGAEELGRHVDAVCLYQHIEQPRRGHYKMTIECLQPVEGEEYPYTVAYLRRLEQDIQAAPELWLWTHKRWKHKREVKSE